MIVATSIKKNVFIFFEKKFFASCYDKDHTCHCVV